jgi:hypothetical protein
MQNRIMNAIAAHKDELKKLLESLSGDTAISGITFVASLDAYIARRYELLRHQGPRQSAASANKRRINMEPALTQNYAIYYAQHKTSKGRAALFKRFRAAVRKQGPDVWQQLTFGDLFVVPLLHQDNGR